MTGDRPYCWAVSVAFLVLFVLIVLTLRCLAPTSGIPTSLTTSIATLQTLTQAMPGSPQVILESTASKLRDELKGCMSYIHEKGYEVQTANKSMASMIEQVRGSVLECLNTMTDEFSTTLEIYKYGVDESFSWLQSKIEGKPDLLCEKEEFVTEFQTLHDMVASLGKKPDEDGTTTTKLLEFMKSFAQSLQETQNSMAEQQKSLADQLKQMGVIRENMNKLPALVDKIKGMPLETLNYWGMVVY